MKEDDILKSKLNVIEELSTLLVSQAPPDSILSEIVNKIPSVLGVSLVSVLLWNPKEEILTVSKTRVPKVVLRVSETALRTKLEGVEYPMADKDNTFVRSIGSKKLIFTHDVENSLVPIMPKKFAKMILKLVKNQMKAQVIAPMIFDDKVLGILVLGWRKNTISDQEKLIVKMFSNYAAIAISNSRFVNRLQSQNYILKALNAISSKLVSTLDPTRIAQITANQIAKDFGFASVLIATLDETGEKLSVLSVTENKIIHKLRKLLDKEIPDYVMCMNDPKFSHIESVKAIKNDKMYTTDDLLEAFTPPVPGKVIKAITKFSGIKSVATLPVKARGKIIGAVGFGYDDKCSSEISDDDESLMVTLSHIIGVALDNARSYQENIDTLEELKDKVNALEQSRQRERDMVDIMGHELRTPISVVNNYFLLLKGLLSRVSNKKLEGEDLEKCQRYIKGIDENVKREIKLINVLLNATKIDSENLELNQEPLDIRDIIREGLVGMETQIENKGLYVKLEKMSKRRRLPKIYADKIRLLEVVDNLLSNAVKYTDIGGITLSVDYDKNFMTVSISDTGVGISKKHFKNLGKKFYRANQYLGEENGEDLTIVRPGGTGLGLYVTYALVEEHGGKIWVESKEGKGSTFHFTVPLYKK